MTELIPLFSALSGALVAGFVGFFATRSTKAQEWRLVLAKDQAAIRQKLYSELLVEVQRLIVLAIERKVLSATELDAVHGKFAEVSLLGGDDVVKASNAMVDHVLSCHTLGGPKPPSNFYDLKMAFIVSARKDIASVLSH